jgi:NADPH2:quinone reductase
MKAAYIEQQGSPQVIKYGELPDPAPAPGQVLVRVGAVAVNPVDTYIRGGLVAAPEFPYVVGCDVAGTVESVGDGVSRFKIGDRVWGSNQGLMGRQGTFSELVAIDEEWLYAAPANAADSVLAASALVGITAHLGLFLHGGLNAGERVFVNGGAGGVGSAVVQLAVAAGAAVVTTAGDANKADYCREIGAADVLDYKTASLDAELTKLVQKDGGFDVWFETQRDPNPERTIPLMNKRGRIVLMAGRNATPTLPVGPTYVNDLRFIGFAMFNASATEQADCAAKINELIKAGTWKANIGQVLKLSQAADAHAMQEDKTIHGTGTLQGKIVLVP